ncbi:DsbC family protein [Bathymodiolus septemdierum thioautotrophic gill symbiont]|uniref:Thiol:disulfide interchange protein n=1 Tax=endosymbiont of Bathymodiolus septemdierum str. Myojin knoll TaxID=1303921 RepID=A0A0P0URA1_9GAMM|nr:DsbC family protein [Bathymodiolus septemdierum thioautotrophic gill symbiont]BAS67342.1 thiol:disulfide interchange protein DsbC [endosymbiont of Bathymodiolus septemdierum str. Myojin knoll]
MFKKILLVLMLASTQSIADKDNIIKNLAPFFGEINANDIEETNFKGVSEVLLRSPIIRSVLISNNGRYLIEGDVVDLFNRKKMTASNKVKQLKKSLIDTLNDKDKIIFKAEDEKYVVHVFTDVDCPFCRKLHAEVPTMNEMGITVKYLASPLASLHPTAQGSMEKIWCALDKAKAMDDYKKYKTIPDSKNCDNPVAEQLALASKLGVNGTPAIFLSDGTHIPGYAPADKLLKAIKTLGK